MSSHYPITETDNVQVEILDKGSLDVLFPKTISANVAEKVMRVVRGDFDKFNMKAEFDYNDALVSYRLSATRNSAPVPAKELQNRFASIIHNVKGQTGNRKGDGIEAILNEFLSLHTEQEKMKGPIQEVVDAQPIIAMSRKSRENLVLAIKPLLTRIPDLQPKANMLANTIVDHLAAAHQQGTIRDTEALQSAVTEVLATKKVGGHVNDLLTQEITSKASKTLLPSRIGKSYY